jgi:hypothetical protein
MSRYGIERGDVLLSLQLALTQEEEEPVDLEAISRQAQPAVRPQAGNGAAHHRPSPPPRVTPPVRERRPLPGIPPAPPRPVIMVDPTTGAGTMAALRRDLAVQKKTGGRPDGKVIGLEVETLDQFRLVMGPGAADEVIRGLVEVAPFALQARDRVYRFGRDKLILWLGVSKDAEVENARSGLEQAVTRFLADRGFPEVRLLARALDPAALAR